MSSHDPEPPLEDQKKGVLPYLTRAQEIQGSEPKVAYYCRLYAVDQAMKFSRRAKEIGELMLSTFAKLEKDKRQLTLDFENDRWHCEAFATKIFNNADRADRAGRADLNTAKAFYASAYFLAMLNQFGDMQPDIVEKQKYAGWRAAEIRKAIREGRPPLPPAGSSPATASSASLMGELDALSAASAGNLQREPSQQGDGSSSSSGPNNASPAAGPGMGASAWPPPASASAWPPPAAAPPPLAAPPPAGRVSASGGGQGFNTTLRPPSRPASPPPPAAQQPQQPPMEAPFAAPAPFGPGTRLLVRVEDGGLQQGTVGQVMRGADGERRYKVALADRFVVVPEGELVPLVPDGAPPQHARQSSYLVGTMDGSLQPDERPGRWDNDERRVTSRIIPPSIVQHLPPPSWPSHPAPADLPASDPPQPPPPLYQSPPPPLQPPSQQHPTQGTPPPPPPPTATYQHASPPPPYRASSPPPPFVPPPHPSLPQPPQSPYRGGVALAPTVMAAALPLLPVAMAAATANGGGGGGHHKPSLTTITAAQKSAKHAVSALSFEDIPTAVRCLQEALTLLTKAG